MVVVVAAAVALGRRRRTCSQCEVRAEAVVVEGRCVVVEAGVGEGVVLAARPHPLPRPSRAMKRTTTIAKKTCGGLRRASDADSLLRNAACPLHLDYRSMSSLLHRRGRRLM